MALSADTPRTYSGNMTESSQPVQASSSCYAGGAASRDSGGEVGPLAASEAFAGFFRKKADNAAGAAGAIDAALYDSGNIELTITGLDDNDDIGDIVYASDDNTFTLTNATGLVPIGRVRQIDLTNSKAIVAFHADTQRDQVLA